MLKRLLKTINNEKGQALPIVLVMLLLGGLLVTPTLSYAATSVKHGRAVEIDLKGLYAADAGMEDVLWSLKQGSPPHTSLSQNPNGMQVTMNTVNRGAYTLMAGSWVTGGASHSDDLSVNTTMVWYAPASAYQYTISLTWSGSGTCKIVQVGARLPVGYDYQPDSAASFGSNLSTAEPVNQLGGEGAHMLTWTFSQTSISTRTQIFYATGNGDLEGDYGWAIATRDDVGVVGEFTGTFYDVTATATLPSSGTVTGQIVSDVLISGSTEYVLSWRAQ